MRSVVCRVRADGRETKAGTIGCDLFPTKLRRPAGGDELRVGWVRQVERVVARAMDGVGDVAPNKQPSVRRGHKAEDAIRALAEFLGLKG